MAEAAGYLLIAVALLHVVGGAQWVDLRSLVSRVPSPWENGELQAQRDFWSHLGSFAIPTALLGALVAWSARRGIEPPPWFGWLVLAFFLGAAFRVPRGGFWLGLVPAGLLIAASLT